MASTQGQFVWFECMNRDNEAAKAFYPRVVGWSLVKFDGPFDYWMFAGAAGPIGGSIDLRDDPAGDNAPCAWMVYVGADDADASAARAKELGGSVLGGPIDIPGVGRMYVIADPQGAVFSLHQSASADYSGPPAETPMGGIGWVEVLAKDQATAWPFYEQLFGWETATVMDMGAMGPYRVFGKGGRNLGGMMNAHADYGPPRLRIYARVPSIEAAIAATVDGGGKVVVGPLEVPGGDKIAVILDNQGMEFAMVENAAK